MAKVKTSPIPLFKGEYAGANTRIALTPVTHHPTGEKEGKITLQWGQLHAAYPSQVPLNPTTSFTHPYSSWTLLVDLHLYDKELSRFQREQFEWLNRLALLQDDARQMKDGGLALNLHVEQLLKTPVPHLLRFECQGRFMSMRTNPLSDYWSLDFLTTAFEFLTQHLSIKLAVMPGDETKIEDLLSLLTVDELFISCVPCLVRPSSGLTTLLPRAYQEALNAQVPGLVRGEGQEYVYDYFDKVERHFLGRLLQGCPIELATQLTKEYLMTP